MASGKNLPNQALGDLHDDGSAVQAGDSNSNSTLIVPMSPPPPTDNPWEEAVKAQTERVIPQSFKSDFVPPPLDEQQLSGGFAESTPEAQHFPLPTVSKVSETILSEFDPLAHDVQEQLAKQAWESSDSHPPPPRTPSPKVTPLTPGSSTPPPMPPSKDIVPSSDLRNAKDNDKTYPASLTHRPNTPSTSSSFPSLAAFARTFSIPTLVGGRGAARPLSVDTARAVPSPATLSLFAAQQQQSQPQPQSERAGDEGEEGDRATLEGGSRNQVVEGGEGDVRESMNARGRAASIPARLGGDNDGRAGNEAAVTLVKESGSAGGSPSPGSRGEDGVAFDFQKFLDQMKARGAEPVAKYLRSFLSNFAKRTFTVHDQVKIINDFLVFISAQMRNSEVWKHNSDAEFDNAMEGMEKLVMNRLYEFTFTPQVVHCVPPRPITTDDLEKDRVLSQRIALFGWVTEKHLDIPIGEGSRGFMMFAQQELLKINHYKAPRDKLICILNCCKVIFGLIRHLRKEEGADAFVPILIFVVLKANPDHLMSNVEFINRFRNPSKLQSEAGYYLSSLMGAVSFIETMDHTSLSEITQHEFEKNVEEAILSLPQSTPHSPAVQHVTAPAFLTNTPVPPSATSTAPPSPHAGEESAQPLSLSLSPASPLPPHSSQQFITSPALQLSEDAKRLLQKTGDTISKPLSAIGRIFSEALDGAESKLTYLPGPWDRERERQQAAALQVQVQAEGQPPVQMPPPPQTPAQYGAGGGWPSQEPPQPPIQTPYKPRIRRVPSPSFFASPGASPSPSGIGAGGGYGPGPEDTPTRVPAGGYQQQHYQQQMYGNTLTPPRVSSLAAGGYPGGAYHQQQMQLQNQLYQPKYGETISRTPTPALDFSGVQREIENVHDRAEEANLETLVQIFPGVEREVASWVLEANAGDLGKSIEGLLEMTSAA